MRSGFVAVVGRPNVGKSTLVNALVGEKVAITSSRPQTTRNTIRGVLTVPEEGEPEVQAVFVDTPGLHRPRTALGEHLNTLVDASVEDADVVLFVLDAHQPIGPGDRRVAERVQRSSVDVVVVVNKVDLAAPGEVVEMLAEASEWGLASYIPISATKGEGIETVAEEVLSRLPEGPPYFPPGMRSDQRDGFMIREIIREKYLDRLRDELPHSLAVDIRDLETRDNGSLYVDAALVVERDSQKGIVIGRKGELIRQCGQEAREELERRFGVKVFLDLRVVVEKDWQEQPLLFDRMGFE
ncbi:MAG: GTPase Era [Acidimicrobiia bacterium]|nr:GTPase Era [Acidimicrobiia bacterium]